MPQFQQLRHLEASPIEQELYEAALQYVSKVSGYHNPSRANNAIFEAAMQEIARSTKKFSDGLE